MPEAAEMGSTTWSTACWRTRNSPPGRKPGVCNYGRAGLEEIANKVDVNGPQVQALIRTLLDHPVAVTSTLAGYESFVRNWPPMPFLVRQRASMLAEAWSGLETRAGLAARAEKSLWTAAFTREMAFARAFAAAGGVLMAGCDPTGYRAVLPGFGDQRNIELLVEAGFTPLEAIRIATLNGAVYLGQDKEIGPIATGKQAELVVVKGDPAKDITAVEPVELVKKGVGYDPGKLIESTRGMAGAR
jgi:hypothetical protein